MFNQFLGVQTFLCLIIYFILSLVIGAALNVSKDVVALMLIGSFILALPTAYISLEGWRGFIKMWN